MGQPASAMGGTAATVGTAATGLFSPGRIGHLRLKNRLFVAGHSTNLALANLPTGRHVDYWGERASGGAAFVITDPVRVHPNATARSSTMGGFDDDAVRGWSKITAAVHRYDAKAFAQLLSLGRESSHPRSLVPSWTPSPLDWSPTAGASHPYDRDTLAEFVASYREAARRVVAAGYDAIEVHLGHGHGLHQFLSPASNVRRDEYGGTVDRRLRAPSEVLDAVYSVIDDTPVGVRVSADEFVAGGLRPPDVIEIVSRLLERFPVAFVHVSHSNAGAGGYSLATQIADMSFPSAPFREFPALFRRNLPRVPVLAVCRMDDLGVAGSVVERGEADFVGMARGHIADPHIVRKWEQGRPEEVTPCIACNECISRIGDGLSIGCTVNPEAGRERAWEVLRRSARSQPRRSVLVVGGGVAGMSCALEAARVGHRVRLVEAGPHLGGVANVAASMRHRSLIGKFVRSLERRVEQAKVEVCLGTAMDLTSPHPGGWDDVLLATGAQPAGLVGLDGVLGLTVQVPVLSATDALSGASAALKHLVVVDYDGGWAGLGVAEELMARGHSVTFVTAASVLGWRIGQPLSGLMVRVAGKMRFHLQSVLTGADGDSVSVRDNLNNTSTRLHPVDGLVVAHPGLPLTGAPGDGLGGGLRYRPIGDAYAPRGLLRATFDGALAGAAVGLARASLPKALVAEL